MTSPAPGRRLRPAHLLALTELAGIEVVAGSAGLEKEIVEVALVRTLGDAETLRAGALVVTAFRAPAGYELDVLVRAGRGRGVVGLVAVGPGRILSSTRRMCDRLALPLLALADAEPLRVAGAIARHVDEPRHLAVERITAVTRGLPDAPADAEQILRPVRDGLAAPVALVGRDRTILAGDGEIDIAGSGLTPHAEIADVPDGHLILVPVVLDDPVRPELWLAARLPPSHPAWLEGVVQLLRVVAFAVTALTARQRVGGERDARDRGALLTELMDGGQAVGRHAVERALRAGWRLDGWHTGLYLRLIGEGPPHPTATAVLDRVLRAEGVVGALAERADGWAGWTTTDTEPPSTAYRLAREAVARALDAVRDEIPLVAGIGRPYEGRDGVARTLHEAREASLFAGVTARSGRVEHVDGLGARRYLARWHQSDAFGSYARTLLAPLLDRADLLDTLHVYLDRESSASSTATALGIHRNTVNQRVERAQQLLAVDLTRPDDRLVVQLACRVLRGAGGGPER